ncbi:hypothetical protein B0I35DRAFT_477572 [Stachybotrys elegans]|uniref:Uncharacterized protein n=1 Tax=Stachybotrys elegans TaxID=80388 RepID=A0A8K0WS35_9HYPO|nr:hypothetical protein B0I35DRAFT_477572 [Stachybotrys elegans]
MVLPLDGISPRPTSPPAVHELLRRQNGRSSDETILVAPDATCGFISNRVGVPYFCFNDYTCVFVTSTAQRPGAVACCNSDACYSRASCVGYDEFYSSSACDDGCALDIYTLKCTSSAAPFCNTVSFSGGVIDYWCNTLNISTIQAAVTELSGGPARSFSAVTLTDSSLQTSMTDTSSPPPGPTAPSDNEDNSNGNGNNQGNNGNNSSGNNNNGNNSNNDGGSSTPVGAIVGGVVGGVAAIGLVGLAVFFFLRNKDKKKAHGSQQPQDASHQPPMGQQGAPAWAAGGYDPKQQSPGNPQSYPHSPGGYQSYTPVGPDGYPVPSPSASPAQMPPAPHGYASVPVHEVSGNPADHRGRVHEMA